MARKYFERRSFRNELKTYLDARGWNDLNYREGFGSEETIRVPMVAVHFLPGNNQAFQLGNTSERLFRRIIQVDAYMESEARADAICDDMMDFIDLEPVSIVDNTAAILGELICQDTDSIYSETLPPLLTDPKLGRWRGIVRATLEAHYN